MRTFVALAGFALLQLQLALAAPSCKGLTVDLGYAKYRGYYEEEYNLNIWKRYVPWIV
jgi:hypothetical protein